MLVALYLRRSTDETLQADSLNAQNDILQAYAAAAGHEVVATYRDSASGRQITGRDEFQKLIRDVARGAPYGAILVRDVSRWGRFQNIDESAYWEFFCLMHGVKVIYVEEPFAEESDPMTSVMKAIKRAGAAEASREKARLIQRAQYRSVGRGFRLGGDPPYGMARVLVEADGTPVQTLKPGQRKLINAHRIKLAAGDPAAVAVVRRIYQLFVDDGVNPNAIARRLNTEGVPSPRGVEWKALVVTRILTNPAYAGIAHGRFQRSQNFAEEQQVFVEDAWPAIVPRETWDAVQRHVSHRRWLRTPDGLVHQVKQLFERWGVVADGWVLGETAGPTRDTFRKYFDDGNNEAVLIAYAGEIASERARVVDHLSQFFRVEDDGATVLLDGSLRVGFKAGFPRQHRLGRMHWRFRFDAEESQDVTVCMAFSAGAAVAMYFRIVNSRFRGKARILSPQMHSHRTHGANHSLEDLAATLRRDLYRYSGNARARFLEAVRDLALINTSEVARSLGWPTEKGWAIYHALRAEGVSLPPLKKQNGRRITVICEECGARRIMLVSNAVQLKTSLCGTCAREARARYRTCPDCGDRRRLRDSRGVVNGMRRCPRCASRARALTFAKSRDASGRFASPEDAD